MRAAMLRGIQTHEGGDAPPAAMLRGIRMMTMNDDDERET
jgi:hypothetical protein